MKWSIRGSRTLIDRCLVLLAIIGAWQAASMLAGSYWVASPYETVVGLFEGVANQRVTRHAVYTLKATLIGLIIGGVPGVALPFLLYRLPRVSTVLEPYFVAGYGIPKVALAPLFIVFFGIGIESKIAVVASAAFFIVLFSTRAGVQVQNTQLANMARIAGASDRQVGWYVVLPGAVSYVLAGFRIAVPYAISSAVIAELISSNQGLGFLVQSSAMDFDTRGVFVALLAITLISVSANVCVNVAERYFLRWKPAGSGAGRLSSMES